MAAASSSSKLSMKLLIDAKEQRVLFAEADKKAVDFLFHLLTLPLGTVTRLLRDRKMVGCLGNLYKSVENLNETYIQPGQTKDVLLKPKVLDSDAVSGPLLSHPDINRTSENASDRSSNIFGCAGNSPRPAPSFGFGSASPLFECQSAPSGISFGIGSATPSLFGCQSPTAEKVNTWAGGTAGGFVRERVTYMVMDDLTVKPMSTISGVALFKQFHVTDLGNLEEKEVELGPDEALDLLKASLMSNTVLTTVFLKNAYSSRKV